MDFLRYCYTADCQFGTDPDNTRRIRWYRCAPGAKLIGFAHHFGSEVWYGGEPYEGVGERPHEYSDWWDGAFPVPVSGLNSVCGSLQVFVNGWPGRVPMSLPRFDNGLAVCCGGSFPPFVPLPTVAVRDQRRLAMQLRIRRWRQLPGGVRPHIDGPPPPPPGVRLWSPPVRDPFHVVARPDFHSVPRTERGGAFYQSSAIPVLPRASAEGGTAGVSVSSITVTWSEPTLTGSTLAVAIVVASTSPPSAAGWTVALTQTVASGAVTMYVMVAQNAASQTSQTFTLGASSIAVWTALEAQNASTASVDVTSQNGGIGTSASTGTTPATTFSNDLAIAFFGQASTTTPTASVTGYTFVGSADTGTTPTIGSYAFQKQLTTTGTQSATATWSASVNWGACLLCIK